MLVDLHTHALPASRDAYDGVAAIAREISRLGVDAIALTDHGSGCDYASARAILAEYGMQLVPGREINTPLGHVLVLSTDEEWLAALSERCALPLDLPRVAPAALVWAHPAGWRIAGATVAPDPSKGARYVHAVEILNGERLWQLDGVRIAAALADALGTGGTGGSDAHRAEAAGRCLTLAEGARDAGEVVEAILAKTTRPVMGQGWAEANSHVYERADLLAYAWPEQGGSR